jgi:hypothetical protein
MSCVRFILDVIVTLILNNTNFVETLIPNDINFR